MAALPPDLRVRASACMPLGSRASSRPGMFLHSSTSVLRVSNLARRRCKSSSGISSGGESEVSLLASTGTSGSVPPSLGMGSDIITPLTDDNVFQRFHICKFYHGLPTSLMEASLRSESVIDCSHMGEKSQNEAKVLAYSPGRYPTLVVELPSGELRTFYYRSEERRVG